MIELVTAPTVEPVTIAEARDQLLLEHDELDAWLDAKIVDARRMVEHAASKALLTQTWRLKMDTWPVSGVIHLPRPPLQSVTSIAYVDTNGASQTWSSTLYDVDTSTEPGRIAPKWGESFPSIRVQDAVYAITITYVAGYLHRGDERLTDPRKVMLELVALWHYNRQGYVAFGQLTPISTIEAGVLLGLTNFRCVHEFTEELA